MAGLGRMPILSGTGILSGLASRRMGRKKALLKDGDWLHSRPVCGKLSFGFQPIRMRCGNRIVVRHDRVSDLTSAGDSDVDIVLFLLIGLAAGWLAGQLVKRRGSGWVEDLIIGVIGALIGGFLFGLLGVNTGGLVGSLISATVGAVILLFLLRYIRRV